MFKCFIAALLSTELLGDKMLRGHGGLFGDKQISVWFYCSRFYFEQLFMSRFKDLHRIHQTLTVHYWACYSKAFLWNKTFWGCADVVDVRASLLVVESVYPRYKKQTSLLSFVLFKSKTIQKGSLKQPVFRSSGWMKARSRFLWENLPLSHIELNVTLLIILTIVSFQKAFLFHKHVVHNHTVLMWGILETHKLHLPTFRLSALKVSALFQFT